MFTIPFVSLPRLSPALQSHRQFPSIARHLHFSRLLHHSFSSFFLSSSTLGFQPPTVFFSPTPSSVCTVSLFQLYLLCHSFRSKALPKFVQIVSVTQVATIHRIFAKRWYVYIHSHTRSLHVIHLILTYNDDSQKTRSPVLSILVREDTKTPGSSFSKL